MATTVEGLGFLGFGFIWCSKGHGVQGLGEWKDMEDNVQGCTRSGNDHRGDVQKT